MLGIGEEFSNNWDHFRNKHSDIVRSNREWEDTLNLENSTCKGPATPAQD